MSINSCTIDCSTIDAICESRRSAIIDDLLNHWVQGGGRGSAKHVNPHTRKIVPGMYKRDPDQPWVVEEDVDPSTLEHPTIQVTVEFGEQKFSQTVDRGDEQFRPMINVYNLSLKDSGEAVNITDIRIKVI